MQFSTSSVRSTKKEYKLKQYLDLVRDVYENGYNHTDRTGVGRRSIFGAQLRFKMSDGFPLLTARKIFTKSIVGETLWFLSGSSDVRELVEKYGVHIWDNWAVKEEDIKAFSEKHFPDNLMVAKAFSNQLMNTHLGDIGRIYGRDWRHAPVSTSNPLRPIIPYHEMDPARMEQYQAAYKALVESPDGEGFGTTHSFEAFAREMNSSEVDQMAILIKNLKEHPYSSRHVVTSWLPDSVPSENCSPQENVLNSCGALAACHVLQQYMVMPPKEEGGKMRLSLQMYQRSADLILGSPSNIAQYAMLLHMVAQVVDMEPYEFIYSLGDVHLYLNHLDQIEELLSRETPPLPTIKLNPEISNLFQFKPEDIEFLDYNPGPTMKFDIAV